MPKPVKHNIINTVLILILLVSIIVSIIMQCYVHVPREHFVTCVVRSRNSDPAPTPAPQPSGGGEGGGNTYYISPELLGNGSNGLYVDLSTGQLRMTQISTQRTVFMVDLYQNGRLYTESKLGGTEGFEFRSQMKKGIFTCTISFMRATGERTYLNPSTVQNPISFPSSPGNLTATKIQFSTTPYQWWLTSLCSELCEPPVGYRIKVKNGEFRNEKSYNVLGTINYDQTLRNADNAAVVILNDTNELLKHYRSHDKLANFRFYPATS